MSQEIFEPPQFQCETYQLRTVMAEAEIQSHLKTNNRWPKLCDGGGLVCVHGHN